MGSHVFIACAAIPLGTAPGRLRSVLRSAIIAGSVAWLVYALPGVVQVPTWAKMYTAALTRVLAPVSTVFFLCSSRLEGLDKTLNLIDRVCRAMLPKGGLPSRLTLRAHVQKTFSKLLRSRIVTLVLRRYVKPRRDQFRLPMCFLTVHGENRKNACAHELGNLI
jgi:hypothetical protein